MGAGAARAAAARKAEAAARAATARARTAAERASAARAATARTAAARAEATRSRRAAARGVAARGAAGGRCAAPGGVRVLGDARARAGGLARAVGELLEGAVVERQAHIEERTCEGEQGHEKAAPEHTHVMCVHTGRGSKYSAAEHAKVLGPDAAAAPPTVATFQLRSLLPGLVRRRCYESRRESKVTRRGYATSGRTRQWHHHRACGRVMCAGCVEPCNPTRRRASL